MRKISLQCHVVVEFLYGLVLPRIELDLDGPKIHGRRDDVIVIHDPIFLHIHRGVENSTALDFPEILDDLLTSLLPLLNLGKGLGLLKQELWILEISCQLRVAGLKN